MKKWLNVYVDEMGNPSCGGNLFHNTREAALQYAKDRGNDKKYVDTVEVNVVQKITKWAILRKSNGKIYGNKIYDTHKEAEHDLWNFDTDFWQVIPLSFEI